MFLKKSKNSVSLNVLIFQRKTGNFPKAIWQSVLCGINNDAYRRAVNATATKENPWYVIPADQKWYKDILYQKLFLMCCKN
ncbi:MAG: hypothetical protein ACLRZ6_06835 [Lachnospiraceae bacterium]